MSKAKRYVLALDQGTSSSKAFLFDHQGRIISRASRDFRQIYPRPGWVEHDPDEIWNSQWEAAQEALDAAIAIFKELGSRLELGRAFYHRGIMRAARGGTADGRADVERALGIFAEIGAGPDHARAEQFLRA